ncbi:MAG: 3-phenylpropionate-dihydrodiol/cinnamic acid-dihydrodiol dehydrogenase [Fimbriimonadaceae bacterium]|nr:3-phenylpropionate-dihydrodiol/cinnamic acid-dihydrodiol dehydrogenase [Fimbriimonadaceae bacterium]
MPDPLTGAPVEVLWVKGSGGDLGTMKRTGLASLYMDRLLALEAKFTKVGLHEDEIVGLYAHCTFNLNPTASSIDTPLHAYVPFKHVDHMHPDAAIAVAAAFDSESLTQEVFGGEVGWLPWKRPGFELGLMLRDLCKSNPSLKGAVMGSHGIINWADDPRECYELTLRLINRAQEFIDGRGAAKSHPFGDRVQVAKPTESFRNLLPELRGKVAFEGKRLIAHVRSDDRLMDFLDRSQMRRLAALGTSCPDHFLRTKIRPMILDSMEGIDSALAEYRSGYAAYYDRCKRPDSPAMRNPNPSVVLVPGLGMVSFGKNKAEARVTGEFYMNAIGVMGGAETLTRYTALPEQEAFDIEYWLLEEAKLRRMPPEKELSRQIAVISGGAQGIGLATAKMMAELGACVVILDLNADKIEEAKVELAAAAGTKEHALGIRCDVTKNQELEAAFGQAVDHFGGVDIVVVSAGNARRGTVADTTDEDYAFQSDLLMKAYFETMRAGSQIMIRQGTGGAIVVVASKNGIAAGSNAAVYSAAKAFELHLARCSAGDLAKHGIRVNAVNPDAVLQGSAIWSDQWRSQTAASLGIPPDQLEEHYRKRSLLGVTVSTDDVAEAICWLASEARSSRTTGTVIPVDGGNKEGFPR